MRPVLWLPRYAVEDGATNKTNESTASLVMLLRSIGFQSTTLEMLLGWFIGLPS